MASSTLEGGAKQASKKHLQTSYVHVKESGLHACEITMVVSFASSELSSLIMRCAGSRREALKRGHGGSPGSEL